MSRTQMLLVNLLCEKIGIKTLGDLDKFKKHAQVTSNDMLIRRLALWVACDKTIDEVDD